MCGGWRVIDPSASNRTKRPVPGVPKGRSHKGGSVLLGQKGSVPLGGVGSFLHIWDRRGRLLLAGSVPFCTFGTEGVGSFCPTFCPTLAFDRKTGIPCRFFVPISGTASHELALSGGYRLDVLTSSTSVQRLIWMRACAKPSPLVLWERW